MGSFSVFHWIIFIFLLFVAYIVFINNPGKGTISAIGGMICPNCGTRGEPKTITKGNLAIELILWLCFLIPGLIYSIWRMTSKVQGCPSCGQPDMINVTTPNGKLLIEKFYPQTKAKEAL